MVDLEMMLDLDLGFRAVQTKIVLDQDQDLLLTGPPLVDWLEVDEADQ